jgi:hypothetical protein
MSLLRRVDLRQLTPSRLWADLDAETRRLAVEAVYDGSLEDDSSRLEADQAIAAALRYRPQAVRKLPASKRIRYVLRAVRPDDSLASTLLLALHVGRRAPMLGAFLDRLGIEHEGGMIRVDRLAPPAVEKLEPAIEALYERFPAHEVDLYLAALVAMDPDTWSNAVPVIERRLA